MVLVCATKRRERDRKTGAQERVDGQNVGKTEIPDRSREGERRINTDRRRRDAPSRIADDEDREPGREHGRESRCSFGRAEHREAACGHPVLQRRLLEIFEAVEARRQEIVRDEHLARYLGVASFVRMLQGASAEIDEPQRGRHHYDEKPANTGERGTRRLRVGRGGEDHRAEFYIARTARQGWRQRIGLGIGPCLLQNLQRRVGRWREVTIRMERRRIAGRIARPGGVATLIRPMTRGS